MPRLRLAKDLYGTGSLCASVSLCLCGRFNLRMRVAAAQIDIAIGQTDQNLEKILARMGEAAANKADLVIFPECSLQGYCYGNREEAWAVGEELSGAVCARLADEAKK